MKKILIFLGILLSVFIGSGLFFYQKGKQVKKELSVSPEVNFTPRVSFYNQQEDKIASFKVEIASTSAQHKKGLMHRENLPEDKGMLFIFKQEQPLSFWMKNTLISLDIIYISRDKKVVSISANALPCKKDPCPGYPSEGSVKYVLEINAGLADRFGIKNGTKSIFNLP